MELYFHFTTCHSSHGASLSTGIIPLPLTTCETSGSHSSEYKNPGLLVYKGKSKATLYRPGQALRAPVG
jgi:hypothetical protein